MDNKSIAFLLKLFPTTLFCGVLALGTGELQAAKRPYRREELEKGAQHIVSGKVVAVTSKVQKSKVERSPGIHRDTVYTIKLRMALISK
ncbi:MAG: hypothetical protein VB835_04805 [Pirellulales bacterium]